MKRNVFLTILLVLCLLVSICGCRKKAEPTILELKTPPETEPAETQTTPVETEPSLKDKQIQYYEPPTEPLNTQDVSQGVTLELDSGLIAGKLLYHINSARLVSHRDDIPEKGDFRPYDSGISRVIDGQYVYYNYPDFIEEDGSFMEDCYLLLVEITIESDGAEANTDPEKGGRFDDPYLFAAEQVYLTDIASKDKYGDFPVMTMSFFSNLAEFYEQDPCLIRLEPGQKQTYTFGYILDMCNEDGTRREFSNLCICDSYGNRDSTLVMLGLDG